MTLAELLGEQRNQQLLRWGVHVDALPPEERADFIRGTALGLVAEVFETLGEVGWRPWREGYGTIDRKAYLDEVADVLVFAANLAVAVGAYGDELTAAVRRAQAKNAARIASGETGDSFTRPRPQRA